MPFVLSQIVPRSIFFLAAFLFMAIANETNAATPLHLSLQEALTMAKEKSVSVIIANERVQQAMARLSQARSTLLPQLNGTVNEQAQTINLNAQGIQIPGQSGIVGPFETFDARIKLTQTLFDFAAVERLKSVRAGQSVSEAEAAKARQDAMALVAALYIEAKRAQDTITLADALLKRDTANVQLMQTQLKIGTGSDVALQQAQAQLADSQHRIEQAKAEALSRRLDFAASLSIPNNQPLLFEGGNLPTEAEWVDHTEHHPDIQLAEENIKQSQADKKTQVADYFPKLNGGADYGNIGRHISNTDGTYSLGVQLSVPIFDGGLKSGRYKEATSRLRENETKLGDVRRHVTANVLSARETIKQTTALVSAAKAKETAARKELQLAQNRLETGIGSRLDFVVASANEAIAKDGESEASAAHQMAQINLSHAMGNMEGLCK